MSSEPVLYQWLISPSAEKARRALGHKGVAYRIEETFFFDRRTVESVSGQRLIPILKHGEHVIGPRSFDIIKYVDDNFEGPALFPRNSYVLCDAVDRYVESVLVPLSVRAFMPAVAGLMTVTADRKALVDATLTRVCGKTSEEIIKEQENGFNALNAELAPHLVRLDSHFATRTCMLGDERSAADHSVYAAIWYMLENDAWRKTFESMGLRHLSAWLGREREVFQTVTRSCVKQGSGQECAVPSR